MMMMPSHGPLVRGHAPDRQRLHLVRVVLLPWVGSGGNSDVMMMMMMMMMMMVVVVRW
jgi:hypothetical protein